MDRIWNISSIRRLGVIDGRRARFLLRSIVDCHSQGRLSIVISVARIQREKVDRLDSRFLNLSDLSSG